MASLGHGQGGRKKFQRRDVYVVFFYIDNFSWPLTSTGDPPLNSLLSVKQFEQENTDTNLDKLTPYIPLYQYKCPGRSVTGLSIKSEYSKTRHPLHIAPYFILSTSKIMPLYQSLSQIFRFM